MGNEVDVKMKGEKVVGEEVAEWRVREGECRTA